MKRFLQRILALLLLAAAGSAIFHSCSPRRHEPGVLVATEPVQTMMAEPTPLEFEGYSLIRLAKYDISARVLRTKRYYDRDAKISPYDFAVGWGPMSDQAVLDQLGISQGNRFFFYEWRQSPPIPKDQIIRHATNMHLVPENRSLRWKMARTRAGDIVRMQGWLVEVNAPGRPAWRSSLRRTDSGRGACEIMLVTSLEKLPAPLHGGVAGTVAATR